jgi:hypothetical protein
MSDYEHAVLYEQAAWSIDNGEYNGLPAVDQMWLAKEYERWSRDYVL